MNRKLVTLAAAILVASVAFASVAAVKVAWKPKAETALKYKMKATAKADLGGTAVDMEISANVLRTIKEVKTDGKVVVEEVQSDLDVQIQGQSIGEMPKVTSTSTVAANGEVLETKSDAPEEGQSPRMSIVLAFLFPEKELNIGDSWETKTAGKSDKGTFDATHKFTLVAEEELDGVKCYKIEMDSKETNAPTNMTATGTLWIRIEDGESVKSEIKAKNVPISPMIPPVDLEATMTLVK